MSIPLQTPAPRDLRGRLLRDLRISVTDRCNFRCPYCMPSEVFGEHYAFLPRREVLSYEEIARLAAIFVELGARKLRITGGEPLLRSDLPRLVEQLARLDGVEDLALTTNGYLLAGQAQALRDAGLRRVTVSLDALDPQIFGRMNGLDLPVARVLEGLEAAERVGLAPLKINCVVVAGENESELLPLARRFRGTLHVLRLIEFMDVGTLNRWDSTRVVPAREILARIGAEHPLEPVAPTYAGEVAQRYRYRDGQGEIGIISSVSQPFCGDCTRARLSADGRLFTCLFAATGTSLKEPLRAGASDAALREQIAGIWARRSDRYSEERATLRAQASGRVEMYQIGG
jgi:cyclic pyranopterin phosphate synthase